MDYCAAHAKENKHPAFNVYDNLVPIVNTMNCFDKLRVGPDHVSRQVTDTYYLNEDTVRLIVDNEMCAGIETVLWNS